MVLVDSAYNSGPPEPGWLRLSTVETYPLLGQFRCHDATLDISTNQFLENVGISTSAKCQTSRHDFDLAILMIDRARERRRRWMPAGSGSPVLDHVTIPFKVYPSHVS